MLHRKCNSAFKEPGVEGEIERKEGHLFIYETVIYLRDREGQFLSLDEKGFVQFGYGIVRDAGIHAAACQMINPYHLGALSFWGGQIDNEALRQRGGF
ncbi:hypothetical protein [Bartonella sp. AA2SXKL]|uniref:hypothetical protein n=1 Tax=Bartonella sp. AA2SXKL TaxID=3243432 RepID=UPI0035CEB6C7